MSAVGDRYFEDFKVGEQAEFGAYLMTEEEILAFGRKFDPQPFHTDIEAAKHSIFGGLIASGWHTASAMMRMMVDHYVSAAGSMGSPGVDEIRWTKPVRPGDTLAVRITVTQTRQSSSKPDRGTINSLIQVSNQHRETVMTAKAIAMYRCRNVQPG